MKVFTEENILLNQSFSNKEDAINAAGKILMNNGYVSSSYLKLMQKREQVISIYLGNKIAIPHGSNGSENEILESGISLIQVPEGVSFGKGKIANIIIGVAGKNNSHMELLSKIAEIVCDIENVEKLIKAKNKKEILNIIGI